jgi:hypothetical protein
MSRGKWLPLVRHFTKKEFGSAKGDFAIKRSVLGVYQPYEHVDNPKKFDGKTAKELDPDFRGPVRPIETEIDLRTGLKNFMANSGNGWPTSTNYISKSLTAAIKSHRSRGNKNETKLSGTTLRLLGQALHTLEGWY